MKSEFENDEPCPGCCDEEGNLLEGDHNCYGDGCPCCDGKDDIHNIKRS